MKVIIADDEVHICSLIKHRIDWERLGLTLLGVFNDGKQVIEQFQKEPADILLCDIEMPVMNGIEVIKYVRENHQACQCIILSGFRNFEYAHSAMKYGVTSYLLKPIDKDELNRTLETAIGRLRDTAAARDRLIDHSSRLGLFEMLGALSPADDIVSINRRFKYSFSAGVFNVIYAVLTGLDYRSEYLPQIYGIFESALRGRMREFCHDYECYRVSPVCFLVVLNYSEPDGALMRLIYDRTLRDALTEIDGKTQCSCYIGVGPGTAHIHELDRCREAAQTAVCRRFSSPDVKIYFANSDEAAKSSGESFEFTREQRAEFLRIVEAIEPDSVAGWVDDCFRANERRFQADGCLVSSFFYKTIELFLSTMDTVTPSGGDRNKFHEDASKLFDSSKSLNELRIGLIKLLTGEIEQKLLEKRTNVSLYAQQAKNYIQRHYAEAITLRQIAEYLHISEVYLSVVFKNEVKMNYSKYLAEVRVERAKELLKERDMNLTQIANAVGYENATYFSRIFRKVTHINPGEYRRLHQHDIGE